LWKDRNHDDPFVSPMGARQKVRGLGEKVKIHPKSDRGAGCRVWGNRALIFWTS
jgi:hypothetical protein